MPDPLGWLVLVGGALAASVVGGVAGFGAGIIMLPLVAWAIGVRSAVPVLTVTMLVGNLSRIWWSRGEIDRAVVVRFALGAVPATAVGTALYVGATRSEEHTSELQSRPHLVCRLLLETKQVWYCSETGPA